MEWTVMNTFIGDDKEVTNLFNLIQEINRFSNLIENDKTDDAMESTEEEDLNRKSILSPKNALGKTLKIVNFRYLLVNHIRQCLPILFTII